MQNGKTSKVMITLATMLAAMMQAVDTSVANVALPHMQGTFSAGIDEITWVITSYLVANAVVVPITGWLGNFFGRRRIYLLSVISFTLASLGSGAAPNLAFMVVMRVLQGFSGGIIVPMSQAILLEAFPPADRGRALSYFGVGVVFGPIIGPILGGWVTDQWGWRWIFYINLPLGFLAVVLALLFVHDPPYIRKPEGRVDLLSFLFIALGLGGLEVTLSRGERLDWFNSAFIQAMVLVSALGIGLLIWRSLTHDRPLVDLSVLRNKEFAAGVGLSFFQYFVLYATLVLLPLFVQNLLGYTATWAGLVLAPGGVAALLAMLVAGRIVNRIDVRWILLGGVLLMLLAMRMLWAIDLNSTFGYLASVRFIQGFGVGFLFISVAAAAYSTMPAEHMGQATGLYNLVRNEAGSIGIAVVSTLVASRAQFHQARLVEHMNPFNPIYSGQLQTARRALEVASGLDRHSAGSLALRVLFRRAQLQASVMAYVDAFVFVTVVLVLFLPLIPLLRSRAARGRLQPGE
ncbi:MAG: DHA2 family efflux MFS transporter permease subunit [Acidobacteria bacterium]|jgi:MFS transporter, DHA2 family, multidrug resistance protein|nr:DHA2 family efflux MFS transporter permease subunit [Acidobacteriota bacterium]